MKKLLPFLSIILLALCWIKPAQAQAPAPAVTPQSSNLKLGVKMLTDTDGANLDPYMRNLISDLKKHWLARADEAANQSPPQQETIISITIAPDGHLLAMRLESSTHDIALDKAAWTATKETTYSPLPTGLKAPNLKLRAHFSVN